jgi:hypothetical protein
MKRILAAGLLLAMVAAPAANAAEYNSYRCSNSTVLRVIFNEERGTATVVPYGRPSIRLTRADSSGEGFRYTRRGTHELRGSMQEVVWRVGRAEWSCRSGGG